MKKSVILLLTLCFCIISCSSRTVTRNDLEELSKNCWISPEPDFLIIEAKDENPKTTFTSAAEPDIIDTVQDAISVIAVTADAVSDIDNISFSDNTTIVTDNAADIYGASEYTQAFVWIPKSGKKYHNKAECSNMVSPSKVTENEALSLGYTRCKRCY